MKKISTWAACAIASTVLLIPLVSLAAEFRAGEQPSVGSGEKIVNDLYIAGGNVTTSGKVPGDLVAGGGNIFIRGDVGEDLMVGGGTLHLLSNVGDDVRAAGGSVFIEGSIGGDVLVAGGQVSIGGPGILGDIFVGAGKVYINAPVSGDVTIQAETVTLGSQAIISGNLTYTATKELVKEPGAIVRGETNFKLRTNSGKGVPQNAFVAMLSGIVLWQFLTLAVCALVVGLVFRRFSTEITSTALNRPLFELGRGVLVLIGMPIASIILLVTFVGMPLGIIGLLGFIITLLFVWIISPVVVGSMIYAYISKKKPAEIEVSWKTILIGVLVFSVVGIVPFVGSLAQLVIVLIVLGSLFSFKWRVAREWR